jgi:cytochrome b561
MAFSYLVLALTLAFSLNAANRFIRASGTLLAAFALVMLVVSIVMADFDGTFGAMPPPSSPLDPFKPLILNVQAIVASVAAAFLFWASCLQLKRHTIKPVPPLNTASTFGLVSRTAHWITATLIFCLVPMGLFVSVLKHESPDRAEFLAAHQSLGLAVFAVVAVRLFWLLISPPPAPSPDLSPREHRLSRAVHIGLYGLILAFPLSGFLMSAHGGEDIQFFGWALHSPIDPGKRAAAIFGTAHDLVLPFLFYVLIFAHIGAVLKHHFVDARNNDVRRMLT